MANGTNGGVATFKIAGILQVVFAFVVSLGLIGFAIAIYATDHATALGIIGLIGGHWLGIGSVATGRTLGELATNTTMQTLKDASDVLTGVSIPEGK